MDTSYCVSRKYYYFSTLVERSDIFNEHFFSATQIDGTERLEKSAKNIHENNHQCQPFDFNRCSLNTSSNDYPQLFEYENDEITVCFLSPVNLFSLIVWHKNYASSNNGDGSVRKENFRLIYHYIRRKPVDYMRYRSMLIKSTAKVSEEKTFQAIVHVFFHSCSHQRWKWLWIW